MSRMVLETCITLLYQLRLNKHRYDFSAKSIWDGPIVLQRSIVTRQLILQKHFPEYAESSLVQIRSLWESHGSTVFVGTRYKQSKITICYQTFLIFLLTCSHLRVDTNITGSEDTDLCFSIFGCSECFKAVRIERLVMEQSRSVLSAQIQFIVSTCTQTEAVKL